MTGANTTHAPDPLAAAIKDQIPHREGGSGRREMATRARQRETTNTKTTFDRA